MLLPRVFQLRERLRAYGRAHAALVNEVILLRNDAPAKMNALFSSANFSSIMTMSLLGTILIRD